MKKVFRALTYFLTTNPPPHKIDKPAGILTQMGFSYLYRIYPNLSKTQSMFFIKNVFGVQIHYENVNVNALIYEETWL